MQGDYPSFFCLFVFDLVFLLIPFNFINNDFLPKTVVAEDKKNIREFRLLTLTSDCVNSIQYVSIEPFLYIKAFFKLKQ